MDPEFDDFCNQLENLRGQTPLVKPREGLTHRIMLTIRKDREERLRSLVKEMVTSVAVAGVLALLWFFFREPMVFMATGQHS